jgi:hypothetical protein
MVNPFSQKAGFEKMATFWFSQTEGFQEHMALVQIGFKRQSSQVKK